MADERNKDHEDPTKSKDKDKEGGNGNGEKGDIDPTIASIMKDPDAVAKLLQTKRDANAEAKKLRLEKEDLLKKQKEAADAKLAEDGKHKELAENAKAELERKDASFKARIINMALRIEAVKQGISDPDLADLIDASEVKIDEGYNVQNAEEVVSAFKEKKPAFFGKKEEDDDDTETEPQGSQAPDLRAKVKQGSEREGQSPHTRLARSYEDKKKKKK